MEISMQGVFWSKKIDQAKLYFLKTVVLSVSSREIETYTAIGDEIKNITVETI